MNFLKNVWNYFWNTLTWQPKLIVVGASIVLFLVIVFTYKACNRPPKLDEKTIQKGQNAIATQDREQMTKVLAEVETKEALIDANVDDAEAKAWAATQNAKQKAAAMTNDELAAELERKLHE